MLDLIYQPVPEQDRETYVGTWSQAFSETPQEVRDWLARDLGGELRGLYAGGHLVAQLVLLPLEVMTGLHTLPFGGVGAVASPPEARRRGYVARLLRELCDELLARGVWLSILDPFKAAFYRQFGWATFEEWKIYSGAPALLAPFRKQRQGAFEPVGVGQIAELDAIFRGALRGRFGPLVRTEPWWRHEVLRVEMAGVSNYIWRDETGRGRAYICCRWEQRPEGVRLNVREAVALDPLARAQLFAFMADQDNQCEEVRFRAPSDAPVNALMPEMLHCEVKQHFMLRLLDVAGALGAQRFPADCGGRLTIAVADDWLEHNRGVFELEVADGAARCTRLPDGAEADLACDVRVLSQVYTRYLRPRSAAAFGLIEVRDRAALALADRLFAGLAPYGSDHF
jgi:predicted acetyltransferase